MRPPMRVLDRREFTLQDYSYCILKCYREPDFIPGGQSHGQQFNIKK